MPLPRQTGYARHNASILGAQAKTTVSYTGWPCLMLQLTDRLQ